MSQFYVGVTAGSLPPSVPTSFTTDVADNTTSGPGTAVPALNVLQILGRDTTQNNDNGVRTDADPNGGNIVYVELTNRGTGVVTTTDATPTTAFTFAMSATPGVYYAKGSIVAFDITDSAGATYDYSVGVRSDGTTGTEIGQANRDVFEEAAMATADFDITVPALGNTITVVVTGIAGKTIHWNVEFEYRFVS